MISFNIPPCVGNEYEYIRQAIDSHKICGDGPFTKKCHAWMEERFGAQKVLLTTSGTSALDMALLLCDLQPGDEVILPSYTFSSTATAAVMAGAKLVFVDIRPDTMNIDESKIEATITEKTKVIIVMHYAGVACEMDAIMAIAKRHELLVVEDAAQGVMETKNYSMGEGGAILINNPKYNDRAEILREKGTNRSRFFRGQVDKYTWVDKGDSFLPSELNAAYLWAQLEKADVINQDRLASWNDYDLKLRKIKSDLGAAFELPIIPEECVHNAHMYYLKCRDLNERTQLIDYMKERGVLCVFHYIPLHSAPAGVRFGRFAGEDRYTTKESERLVRLPMYFGLSRKETDYVASCVYDFYQKA